VTVTPRTTTGLAEVHHGAPVAAATAIVLASATGDALGAGYEYGCAPLPPTETLARMIGGGLGNFAPGEWTDDTSMAIPVLRAAATWRTDLATDAALDDIALGFLDWYSSNPPDVGGHTARVLAAARRAIADTPENPAEVMTRVAIAATRSPHAVSNGGLMRTAPVVLPFLADPTPTRAVLAAAYITALTHAEQVSQDACGLMAALTWHAARTPAHPGDLLDNAITDLTYCWEPDNSATGAIAAARRALHTDATPRSFPGNGGVVSCLGAALAANARAWETHGPTPTGLPDALDRAVKAGADTDTVAAVAGGLAGALWGTRAIPAQWRDGLHGWPGLTGSDLADLAHTAAA
jgi:ADP-ribosylglycohydrolase